MHKTDSEMATLNKIAQVIFDKKGCNILALDVHLHSSLTDFVLIAEGGAQRHTTGIAHAVMETMEEMGVKPHYVEGLKEGDWIVLDYGYLVIHLFMPGWRDKYQLEQLMPATIVDVKISTVPNIQI